jgi:hypothetical protein
MRRRGKGDRRGTLSLFLFSKFSVELQKRLYGCQIKTVARLMSSSKPETLDLRSGVLSRAAYLRMPHKTGCLFAVKGAGTPPEIVNSLDRTECKPLLPRKHRSTFQSLYATKFMFRNGLAVSSLLAGQLPQLEGRILGLVPDPQSRLTLTLLRNEGRRAPVMVALALQVVRPWR